MYSVSLISILKDIDFIFIYMSVCVPLYAMYVGALRSQKWGVGPL